MLKSIVIITFMLMLSIYTQAHPHHHSLAQLDYNADTQQFEMSFKLLTEDYQMLIKDHQIVDYINQKLQLNIAEKRLIADYQGKEMDVNYTWLYFTYDSHDWVLHKPVTMNLSNKVLLEYNEHQINTIKLNVFEQKFVHNFSLHDKKSVFVIQ